MILFTAVLRAHRRSAVMGFLSFREGRRADYLGLNGNAESKSYFTLNTAQPGYVCQLAMLQVQTDTLRSKASIRRHPASIARCDTQLLLCRQAKEDLMRRTLFD
eukprot:6183945-Pleurochrysis_carterae.AAC.1